MSTENYYTLLEVAKDANDADIKKAYRRLAKKYHPDKNPDGADQFKKISNAYSVLSDKKKRAEYDNPVQQVPRNAYEHFSRMRAESFETMNLEYLNIHIDRHFKVSELMNGIEDIVTYKISKSSLTESKIEDRNIKIAVNLSTAGYPLAIIDGKLGIVVRIRHAGSSQEIDGYDPFNRRQHGIATGDLFVRIIMDLEGLEITETSDFVQTVTLTLSDILFNDELILESKFGKKYKIKSLNSNNLSDLQLRVPDQGLVSAFGKRGYYIFKIIIKKPDFSKFSEDTLTQFKDLLRELDK